MKRILVTGAFGQIGSELVPELQKKYGIDNVVAIGHKNIPADFSGLVEKAEALDKTAIQKIIDRYQIDTVFHLVSLLSAKGEIDPSYTWQLNMESLKIYLDLSVEKKLQIFWPSSIAAFGPTTPRKKTPQQTVLEPSTMYGVTKVAGENLIRYYQIKYGVDVRSLRYPGLISYKAEPGGGTTDYAVAIFYEALRKGKYECYLKPETKLPMMYMDDGVRATVELMEADSAKLQYRGSYNLAAISFTCAEIADELNRLVPVKVNYKPDQRQKIADSWPESIDDSVARKEWGWKHDYSLEKMVKVMVHELRRKLNIN